MLMDETAEDWALIRLEGTFDAAEGWRLHDVLSKLARGTRVALDFTQVRTFHDFAIALLAQDLSALAGRVDARGLCHHQLRILKYFGVDPAAIALDGASAALAQAR